MARAPAAPLVALCAAATAAPPRFRARGGIVNGSARGSVEQWACTDARCSSGCQRLNVWQLGSCERASPTSDQQMMVSCMSPGCGEEPSTPNGSFVQNYYNGPLAEKTCEQSWQSQTTASELGCVEQADGIWTTLRHKKECTPNCTQCESLFAVAACAEVPSSDPPTDFRRAVPGCVACAQRLEDGAGCECGEGCWPSADQEPAASDLCVKSMCQMQAGVPCMDCGMIAPSRLQCEACMRREARAAQFDGRCEYMLKGQCDPAQCGAAQRG